MSKFEVKPGRGRRVFAIVLAVMGAGWLVLGDRASSRVFAAILLLSAWDMAFLPSLPFNLTLGQIYRHARGGWRMSVAARVINVACFGLTVLAIYLQLHGR